MWGYPQFADLTRRELDPLTLPKSTLSTLKYEPKTGKAEWLPGSDTPWACGPANLGMAWKCQNERFVYTKRLLSNTYRFATIDQH